MKKNKNFQKTIYVLTATFYLLTSQIYPYIHLHSHEHDGKVEFEICTTQIERKLATHQCCDSHHDEHQHFLSDRQYLSKKNLQNNDSDIVFSPQSTMRFRPDCIYILSGTCNFTPTPIYLTSHFNKAPPAAL